MNNRNYPGVPSSAQRVVDEIVTAGGTAPAHGGSVDDPDQAIERYGRLDALVCNAGVMPEGPFETIDLDAMRRLVDINLWGAVYP